MDSNKMLIAFVVLVVGFLAFPIVAKKITSKNATAAQESNANSPAQTATAPGSFPELDKPPLLNESNLVNTEWAVNIENYKAKITCAAGGIGYATHPMAKALTGRDYIEGRWRVEYNKLIIEVNFGGKDMKWELRISGDKLYSVLRKGKKIEEVKRF